MGNKMEWLAEWLWGVTCDPLARLGERCIVYKEEGSPATPGTGRLS
jgi:hypothetical protein